MPEFIAQSAEQYEALAFKLAREPQSLAEIRQKLVRNRATAPLFDSRLYTRHLEAAYSHMYETWVQGKKPAPLAVAALKEAPIP